MPRNKLFRLRAKIKAGWQIQALLIQWSTELLMAVKHGLRKSVFQSKRYGMKSSRSQMKDVNGFHSVASFSYLSMNCTYTINSYELEEVY